MTKEQAEKIKKVINKDRHYTTNFQKKTGELRVRVYTYTDIKDYDPEIEEERIKSVVDKFDTLLYRIDHRTYQGFIHDTSVVIS